MSSQKIAADMLQNVTEKQSKNKNSEIDVSLNEVHSNAHILRSSFPVPTNKSNN